MHRDPVRQVKMGSLPFSAASEAVPLHRQHDRGRVCDVCGFSDDVPEATRPYYDM